ncbi:PREDICTED: putative late blight resistance protein homolog R1B-23 [Nicotiana attenuata]|uniref:Late blight resistance protein -like r1a-6 n=1 Tax=Nicotiana attenuata TaxID=49451 RepID=A0A1J6J603_NICAT|nr:PREDICTED: putative late blight resistance protein homolog R1B-23 [Nicotiana attenuata]OIT02673.1 putative late blight resistance protein -like r1a-6 [Nicotiana attenuata]
MDVVETCGEGILSSAGPSAQCSLPSIDEEVVGFEKEAESIMKKLIGGTKELDVISIFGMPGLERTLLIEILKQATGGNCEIKEDDDIADKLRKTLIGRRYLIVLDDIWEVEAWEDLGLCFPKGEDGSRVMVTTRIEEVAKHLQHNGDPYSLRFLTLKESWELLQRKVFRRESCPPDLLEAGLQVAEHCKGLPLVIVLIAGIIVKMARQESLWFEVANDLSSHALGEQSMKVIQSSYEHLEDHLKPCLLYMGLFPEDYKIPVSALLNLWIAEEFVLNVDTENYMEEAARVCLNDLLSRSLVMVSKRRRNGDIKYCILHDVVREFCSAKLREEKFVQLIVPYNPYKHLYNKESRLCTYIHDDLVEQLDHCEYQVDKITIHESEESTKCFGQCSKSSLEFIAHPEFETWKNRSNPLRLLVELKLVRVLHLMDVETSSSWVPTVKLLTHLRYLALYVKDQFEFKWVSHLHDLHTLKVASRKTLFPRSSGLWKMNKLRHVNIRKFFLLLENEEEESSETLLENLKTFRNLRVHVNDRNPRLWWRFPNLEELGLSLGSLPCPSLFPISELHTRLQSLDLECPCKTYRYPHSVGWESYFVFPSNLRNLRIQ